MGDEGGCHIFPDPSLLREIIAHRPDYTWSSPFRASALRPAVSADPVHSVQRVIRQSSQVILGKERQIRLALACLLARGHLLIEDLPGVGKTTLAHVLARLARPAVPPHPVHRDMLPADILGVSVYDREHGVVQVPPRADLLPGDPRRRGEPRHAQDAERAARGDGGAPGHRRGRDAPAAGAVLRHRDAEPVAPGRHVPAARIAARPLPDAHRARLSRPRRRARAAAGRRPPRHDRPPRAGHRRRPSSARCRTPRAPSTPRRRCSTTCRRWSSTRAARPITSPGCRRARRSSLLACARAWALIEGRDHVLPEDVQAVLPGVAGHRLHPVLNGRRRTASEIVVGLVDAVPVP